MVQQLLLCFLMNKAKPIVHHVELKYAKRAYTIFWLTKLALHAQDIIFDPNIFPVATGMEEHRQNAVSFFERY
jgi:cobalamin-dependent methionine synthase I